MAHIQTSVLRPTEEASVLPEVSAEAFRRGEVGWAQTQDADPLGEAGIVAWIKGRVGGARAADWHWRQFGLGTAPTRLYRTGPVWHLPGSGLIIGEGGELLAGSTAKMHSPQPSLAGLPGIASAGGQDVFTAPRNVPAAGPASVFVPWGRFNYGHFILDGLSGLLALEEAGALAAAPPIAPRLNRWQRGLLDLAFPGLRVGELGSGIVRLEGAVYASNLNHFLHNPNALLARLADRVWTRARAGRPTRKLYLSRGGYSMRVMINAREVEAALAERGFEIVQPHRLSAAQQASLMADARIVVGPTGAAMTNALFAAPATTVVEIQPENFASFWLGAACHAADRDWHGYICASPAPRLEAPWTARLRRGFKFGYRVPVDGLLKFLDRL